MQHQPNDSPTLTEIVGGIASVVAVAGIILFIL
jgi:hypothetical protein